MSDRCHPHNCRACKKCEGRVAGTVELTEEQRAEWREKAAADRCPPQDGRILALLDALDAAEARLAAVEADRDEAQEQARVAARTCCGCHTVAAMRADAAEAKFQRCLESENRAQDALATAEAEIARLTADRDSRHDAWAAALKQAHAAERRAEKAEAMWAERSTERDALSERFVRSEGLRIQAEKNEDWLNGRIEYTEAENRRLTALVEAGLALADLGVREQWPPDEWRAGIIAALGGTA
ncbi:hypothetical protein [Nocardioides montaniterrae]